MKDLSLIVWLTQLGFSVAFPLAGFIWAAVWLQQRFSLGSWVIWVGIVLGFIGAIDGLRISLKTLDRLSRRRKDKSPPPVCFNDHD